MTTNNKSNTKLNLKDEINGIIYNTIRPHVDGSDTCDISTECTEKIYEIIQNTVQDIVDASTFALTNFDMVNNDSNKLPDILPDILYNTLHKDDYITKYFFDKDDCKKIIKDIQAEYIIQSAGKYVDDIKYNKETMPDNMTKFTIDCDMTNRWVEPFLGMLCYMELCSRIGHSCTIGFFADGDGDFKCNFNDNFPQDKIDINRSTYNLYKSYAEPERIYDAG
jgi:hypothetical protein